MHDELRLQAKDIIFSPLRYYISLRKSKNFAFIHIKKSKMTIVAMMDQTLIENRIKHHKINPLVASVQKFYNGPCAQIVITDKSNMDEIINLLVEIQK